MTGVYETEKVNQTATAPVDLGDALRRARGANCVEIRPYQPPVIPSIEEGAKLLSAQVSNLLASLKDALEDARDEARELGATPVTDEAISSCLDIARAYASRHIGRKRLRFAAMPRLDGGTVFVIVSDQNGKRVDFEVLPSGAGGSIVSTDARLRVKKHKDVAAPDKVDPFVSWLIQ